MICVLGILFGTKVKVGLERERERERSNIVAPSNIGKKEKE